MLIMFNNYISENRIKNIIRETIIEVFGSCPVRLSSSPGKFSYISRRNLVPSQNFNFLGYEFFILKTVNGRGDEIIDFEYGIAEKKRTKYSNMIERAFINYKLTGNDEVFRQQLKIFSSRVVIAIDMAVYNKLINAGAECGQDYNVYRYVDDIFIFAKSEELATHIVEEYSEIARKYLLQLNETKLFSSRVPFVLDGWLNETNGFTNRMCDMLFTSKEEQKTYVEKISAKEDNAETPTSDVLPYLLKSHVVRYGSKAKQSIMNQLNELICNYPNKDRTIIAYFLSSILNHIGKNKDKCTIFKNDVKGSTVFSFLDLTFYAYSFFPNYGNTQKLLQIISYVRDEYDIFEESTRLQALINKYAFIFDKANINDVVNLFLFCRQAKIEIPYLQEECIVRKIKEKDDPILWATYLMYSQYNRNYSDEIRSCIEKTLLEKINAIRVQKSVYEYREFWWILIFNKCPFITNASQNAIDNAITLLNVPTASGCTHTLVDIFKNYLQNSPIQFFDWDIERNDFLRTLTFKTHEKSIFKNYKENAISLAWGSI